MAGGELCRLHIAGSEASNDAAVVQAQCHVRRYAEREERRSSGWKKRKRSRPLVTYQQMIAFHSDGHFSQKVGCIVSGKLLHLCIRHPNHLAFSGLLCQAVDGSEGQFDLPRQPAAVVRICHHHKASAVQGTAEESLKSFIGSAM